MILEVPPLNLCARNQNSWIHHVCQMTQSYYVNVFPNGAQVLRIMFLLSADVPMSKLATFLSLSEFNLANGGSTVKL